MGLLAVPWLLLLLGSGCAPEGELLRSEAGQLTLRLVNPTDEDPFEGVSTLRVAARSVEGVLVSEDFDVDEPIEVPELREYGLLRFSLAGLSGDEVLSYGQSAQVLVAPGVEPTVPLTFLPVNRALPLSASMVRPRSDHVALRLIDGRVLLVGGRAPDPTQVFEDLELYDPSTGSFSALGVYLPRPVVRPSVTPLASGELLIAGGTTFVAGQPLAVDAAVTLDPDSWSLTEEAPMTAPRAGHCLTMYRDRQGLAVGGSAEEPAIDWLRPETGGEDWTWTTMSVEGLDGARVDGCALSTTGRVYLQGVDASSTGVFDFTEEAAAANPEVQDAFYAPADVDAAPAVTGATLIPLEGGDVWIGGGLGAGGAEASAVRFDMEARTWVSAVQPEAPRVDGRWDALGEGWVALGCGSSDGVSAHAQTAIEVLELEGGGRLGPFTADRARQGCAITALADGALLITGGYGGADADAASAAILVPYGD